MNSVVLEKQKARHQSLRNPAFRDGSGHSPRSPSRWLDEMDPMLGPRNVGKKAGTPRPLGDADRRAEVFGPALLMACDRPAGHPAAGL